MPIAEGDGIESGAERSMAVRLLFVSGGDRVVDQADEARLEGAFFVVTRRHSGTGKSETVLTLPARDVVGAEIVIDGTVTNYVSGVGKRPT